MSVEKIQQYKAFTRVIPYDYTANDGKNLADIIEVVYSWQLDKSDVDDSVLLKRQTVAGEITINDTDKTFSVSILDSDYDNVDIGAEYKQIFGIKYTGDTRFREFLLKDSTSKTNQLIKIEEAWLQITG